MSIPKAAATMYMTIEYTALGIATSVLARTLRAIVSATVVLWIPTSIELAIAWRSDSRSAFAPR